MMKPFISQPLSQQAITWPFRRLIALSVVLTCALASSLTLNAQTTVLSEELRNGALPADWTAENVTFTTAAGGYANMAGTTAVLETPVIDLTPYTSVVLTFDVAKFGTGADGPVTVEVSNDAGATFTAQTFDSPVPTGSTYLTSGPTTIEAMGSQVVIRFTTVGSASAKRLRDIVLSGDLPAGTPTMLTSPSALSGFTYEENSGPSAAQTFEVTAADLDPSTGIIDISASAEFEVSLDSLTWAPTASLGYIDGGSDIDTSVVYVRLIEGLAVGSYTGTLTLEGGTASANVNLAGSVTPEPTPPPTGDYFIDFEGENELKPSYVTGTVNLSGLEWEMTEALIGELANDFKNGVRSARLRGRNGSVISMVQSKPNGIGNISFLYRRYGSDGSQQPWAVEYSMDEGDTWSQIGDDIVATADVQTFTSFVNEDGDVRVRIRLTTEPGATGDRRINVDDILITNFDENPPAILTLLPNELTGFRYSLGDGPSTAQNLTLTALNLDPEEGQIEIAAPADFEISADGVEYFASVMADYENSGAVITPGSFMVRLRGDLPEGEYSGSIVANGGTGTDSIWVSGSVLPAFLPELFDLSQGDFTFTEWNSTESATTYPANMRYYWSNDPTAEGFDREEDGTGIYDCGYGLTSRSRINGRGDEGFSFLATSSAQFLNCSGGADSPGRYVGSAVIGLNTTGLSFASIDWVNRLVLRNERDLATRLQYRIGAEGNYTDFGDETEFSAVDRATGDTAFYSFILPAAVLDQGEVYLRFAYYQLPESPGGTRPEIAVDDIFITSVSPFPGDNPCDALSIACGTTLTGTTVGASIDNVPFCDITSTSAGVWYTYTAEIGGTFVVDLCGSDFDTKLTVYQGECDGLVCVGGNDDDLRPGAPCGLQSFLEFEATEGVTYYIQVHGFGAAEGNFNVSLTCPCLVNGGTIATTASTSICVGTGSPKTLSVSLTGAVGPNSIWGVTPLATGDVVAVAFSGPNFNWDNFAPGEYRLFHMSYDNDVSLQGITNANQLEGCFDLSNAIRVTCSVVDGGTISTSSPTTICVGDGTPKAVSAEVTGAVGPFTGWALLDNDFNVISVNAANSIFNLDLLAPGTYRIFHAAFGTAADIAGITNISQITGCLDNSNAIVITAEDCGAAELASLPNPTTGASQVTFTVAHESRATLEVYDLSGRMVRALFNGQAEVGVNYTFHFDASALPNGVYLYRLTTATGVVTDKFMVAH